MYSVIEESEEKKGRPRDAINRNLTRSEFLLEKKKKRRDIVDTHHTVLEQPSETTGHPSRARALTSGMSPRDNYHFKLVPGVSAKFLPTFRVLFSRD